MIALLKPVKVGIPNQDRVIWQPAVLVGRTIESEPRYDVRLADGAILAGIPYTYVEEAA